MPHSNIEDVQPQRWQWGDLKNYFMNDVIEGSKRIMMVFKRFPEDSRVQVDGELATIVGT